MRVPHDGSQAFLKRQAGTGAGREDYPFAKDMEPFERAEEAKVGATSDTGKLGAAAAVASSPGAGATGRRSAGGSLGAGAGGDDRGAGVADLDSGDDSGDEDLAGSPRVLGDRSKSVQAVGSAAGGDGGGGGGGGGSSSNRSSSSSFSSVGGASAKSDRKRKDAKVRGAPLAPPDASAVRLLTGPRASASCVARGGRGRRIQATLSVCSSSTWRRSASTALSSTRSNRSCWTCLPPWPTPLRTRRATGAAWTTSGRAPVSFCVCHCYVHVGVDRGARHRDAAPSRTAWSRGSRRSGPSRVASRPSASNVYAVGSPRMWRLH